MGVTKAASQAYKLSKAARESTESQLQAVFTQEIRESAQRQISAIVNAPVGDCQVSFGKEPGTAVADARVDGLRFMYAHPSGEVGMVVDCGKGHTVVVKVGTLEDVGRLIEDGATSEECKQCTAAANWVQPHVTHGGSSVLWNLENDINAAGDNGAEQARLQNLLLAFIAKELEKISGGLGRPD